jgi:hypothetical protein
MQTPAQSPFDWAVNDLSRRLSFVEGQRLDGRIAVLEDNMFEIKWMSRGVALTVLGQLFLQGMSVLKGRRA